MFYYSLVVNFEQHHVVYVSAYANLMIKRAMVFDKYMEYVIFSATMIVALGIGIIPSIHALNYPDPYNMIPSFCKARSYLIQTSIMMFRWLMVAASIDRYIHTLDNAYLLRFAHTRMAFLVRLVIIIIWLILPFYCIICIDIRGNVCMYISKSCHSNFH